MTHTSTTVGIFRAQNKYINPSRIYKVRSMEKVTHTVRNPNYPSAVVSELVVFVRGMDNRQRTIVQIQSQSPYSEIGIDVDDNLLFSLRFFAALRFLLVFRLSLRAFTLVVLPFGFLT